MNQQKHPIEAEVIIVRGKCPAGLYEGDRLIFANGHISPVNGSGICKAGVRPIVQNADLLHMARTSVYIACSEAGACTEGDVIFRIVRQKNN